MSEVKQYAPRKCSATNKLIVAKDHASVQLNIGHVDTNGVYTGQYTTYAFSGYVRSKGESDQALNRLAASENLVRDLSKFPTQDKFSPQSRK